MPSAPASLPLADSCKDRASGTEGDTMNRGEPLIAFFRAKSQCVRVTQRFFPSKFRIDVLVPPLLNLANTVELTRLFFAFRSGSGPEEFDASPVHLFLYLFSRDVVEMLRRAFKCARYNSSFVYPAAACALVSR